ncbi:hypothetical protein Gpo141_00013839 [Globisporangium polare]
MEPSATTASSPKDDPHVEFMRRLVVCTFPAVKLEKLSRQFASEGVATLLFEFLHLPDARLLLFTDHGNEASGSIQVYAVPTPRLFSRSDNTCVLYMVKTIKVAVGLDRSHEEILSGTLERNAFESLSLLLHEILILLIGNLHPDRVRQRLGLLASGSAVVKDQVHGLEGCLITWAKHIKNILKQESESMLSKRQQQGHRHARESQLWPMAELHFWATKAANLNSIFAQLHSDSVYIDYKAKSAHSKCRAARGASSPTRVFVRLDAFLERCHDVLELTQTIRQFQKLAAMEIGATKGKTLTASVHQIAVDFAETLLLIKGVHYDLLDLDAKHFEDEFYAFRSKNKELKRSSWPTRTTSTSCSRSSLRVASGRRSYSTCRPSPGA